MLWSWLQNDEIRAFIEFHRFGGAVPSSPRYLLQNLNRCVFNVAPPRIENFLTKKMSQNYRYKKCTSRGLGLVRYKKLVPVTNVHFVGFVTHGMLEYRKLVVFHSFPSTNPIYQRYDPSRNISVVPNPKIPLNRD